jgi:elongation factor Ts
LTVEAAATRSPPWTHTSDEDRTMAVTAALVKELREKSGAGMMDCKKALNETGGDLEAAIDWLRTKGLASAAKKSGRVAAEGLVGVAVAGTKGAVFEVNSETDFVARNESFQGFVSTVTGLALTNGEDLEALKAVAYPETGRTVAEELTHNIATIGENMNLRRARVISVEDGVVVPYVHNAVKPGLGKIGVLVALESAGDKAKLGELAKQIAMHVAAAAPQSLSTDDLDPTAIERERAVLIDQAKDSGKPMEIVEKMVEGRLRKFYQEVVLLEQTFVVDGETKIAKVVENAAKDLGTPVKLASFVRMQLGEGIEREESDFAAEVAAQLAS